MQNNIAVELINNPLKIAHFLGFAKLTELNAKWITDFIIAKDDRTLLGHRGSYKTTCLSLSIAILMVIAPNRNIILMRKTDTDVMEIIRQVIKILQHPVYKLIVKKMLGIDLNLIKSNSSEITTNLMNSTRGTVQLLGLGIGASLTGKHADIIVTDDIVNIKDRISRAEREFTKLIYQELQNIKNPGGRFINTGTTWHKEDAISLMPNVTVYDCYSTGLMTRQDIENKRKKMTPSLFSANYELKHIAAENALFQTSVKFWDSRNNAKSQINNESELLYNGIAHIDAAYGGEDGSALTLVKKSNNAIYVLGKIRKMHIDKCLDEFLILKKYHKCGSVLLENNADKGYLKKEIIRKGEPATGYNETMNKYIKISTYLRKYWDNLIFLNGTDPNYINEIMDYTEDAEHDDCPDSLASILRYIDKSNGGLSLG